MDQCSDEYLNVSFFREILQSPCPQICFKKGKVSQVWSTHKMSEWSKAAVVVDGFELVSIRFCENMHMSNFIEHFVKLCKKKQSHFTHTDLRWQGLAANLLAVPFLSIFILTFLRNAWQLVSQCGIKWGGVIKLIGKLNYSLPKVSYSTSIVWKCLIPVLHHVHLTVFLDVLYRKNWSRHLNWVPSLCLCATSASQCCVAVSPRGRRLKLWSWWRNLLPPSLWQ